MPKPGDSIDRYVIEAVIGEGGMGRVYRALDPRLGRRVALKVLLADGTGQVRTDAAARMMREARAAAAFNHANVVAIHDVGEVDGSPYIAMELVSGHTLRTLIGDTSVSDARKLSLLLEVARGLAAAHRAGLVHRDIKPDNVMVTTDGGVKILDFGIARSADTESPWIDSRAPTPAAHLPSLTAEGHMIGTPQYMAPEQLRAEPLDGRCDQFAWGVMAWELFVGRSPWGNPGNAAQLVTSVLATPARPLRAVLPSIPPSVNEAVGRALEKDRDARFATMDELLAALATMTAEQPARSPLARTGPDPSPMRHRTAGSKRPVRPLLVSLVVVGLFLAGAAVVQAVRHRLTASTSALPQPEASNTEPTSGVVPVAGPADNLFPCRDTYRTLVPAKEACAAGLVAWCATDGTQVACCAEGMVARTHDGACQCPPGGVPSDAPPSKCGRVDGGRELGRLSPSQIEEGVRAAFGKIKLCYETALKRVPDEGGRLNVRFEIGPDGRVFFAHIQDTTMTDPAAQACMLEEFRALRFPPPVGGVVTVGYPIVFASGD